MIIRRIATKVGAAGPSIFMLDVFRTADHTGHIFIPHRNSALLSNT